MKAGILLKFTATACLGVGVMHGVEAASAHGEALASEATANYFNQDGMVPDTVNLQQERADDFGNIRNRALIMTSADTIIAGALLYIARRGRREELFQ